MDNTGRIRRGLISGIRSIVFGSNVDHLVDEYLKYSCKVDKAHLLMLEKQRMISRSDATAVLELIDELEKNDFKPIRAREMRRGIFSLYEDYLIEKLGVGRGGILQYARSRNDLNATVALLHFRTVLAGTHSELIALMERMLTAADSFKGIVMPAYTHFQPAVPITYGHWLLGICFALSRSLSDLQALGKNIAVCPLGAGAVGGTTVPIDVKMTSTLLGFESSRENSIDAVASRDWGLRYLSTISILASTLSRMASQLLIFSTSEFGFFSLPDEIVGGSSLMPNKRNPFILEHVTGKCGQLYGVFSSALSAMHGTPFSNSIAVSHESLDGMDHHAREVINCMQLLAIFVSHAKPNERAMEQSNMRGHTYATELANELVRKKGLSFRDAHHQVGAMITSQEQSRGGAQRETKKNREENIDANKIVALSNYGGGPGPRAIKDQLKSIRLTIKNASRWETEIRSHWDEAMQQLDRQATALVAGRKRI